MQETGPKETKPAPGLQAEKGGPGAAAAARAARRKAALKANLVRRKAQAKARGADPAPDNT